MKFFISVFLLSLSLLVSAQKNIVGRVVSISDGDTFTILTNTKEQVKIRLYGIDCPEKKQDFGTKAKQFTSNLCFGKTVEARVKNNDRYGRKIAIVALPGGKIINKELLIAGMAWHYKYYDKSPEYSTLELKARQSKVGIWSSAAATAPWEFRKNAKNIKSKSRTSVTVKRCLAITKNGKHCRHTVTAGNYCWQHQL